MSMRKDGLLREVAGLSPSLQDLIMYKLLGKFEFQAAAFPRPSPKIQKSVVNIKIPDLFDVMLHLPLAL